MDEYNEYARRDKISIRAMKAFPRSFGIICGAFVLFVTINPWKAIGAFLLVWFVVLVFRNLFVPQDFYESGFWELMYATVTLISGRVIKWLILAGGAIGAIYKGADATTTFLAAMIIVFLYWLLAHNMGE